MRGERIVASTRIHDAATKTYKIARAAYLASMAPPAEPKPEFQDSNHMTAYEAARSAYEQASIAEDTFMQTGTPLPET